VLKLRSALPLLAIIGLAFAATANADDFDKYRTKFDQHIPMPDAGTNWVPQGLAYWKAKDALVISYYYHDPKNPNFVPFSQVWVVKRRTGRQLSHFSLDDATHVGGLAMTKKYLLVAASDAKDGYNLHAYRASRMLHPRDTGVGPQLKAVKRYKVPIKGSYMGTNATGSQLWIGDFDANKVQRYRVVGGGKSIVAASRAYDTPDHVQGVAIKHGRIFYSTSYGNDKASTMLAGPVDATSGLGTLTAPNMSEGITFAHGRVYVVYESSANYYTAQSNTFVTRTIDSGALSGLGY
jgi:hypothetical protein